MKSYASQEEILNTTSIPRPIKVPSVLIGYFGDLIKNVAKMKANEIKSSTSLNIHSPIKPN